ncbi:hypothetical protein K470DRAFT_272916 [Piedraia hortae CBS 480.64]|uniref:Uncharacterized protein n=1 Tax=Piedraia hortae CBS 480.64 TaxID=1314780 RepID=A0A6A7BSH8_9PEZI|nr:hypothetical protein K470DRAFT_272916 [Piedraia hortae CBS 480.64]
MVRLRGDRAGTNWTDSAQFQNLHAHPASFDHVFLLRRRPNPKRKSARASTPTATARSQPTGIGLINDIIPEDSAQKVRKLLHLRDGTYSSLPSKYPLSINYPGYEPNLSAYTTTRLAQGLRCITNRTKESKLLRLHVLHGNRAKNDAFDFGLEGDAKMEYDMLNEELQTFDWANNPMRGFCGGFALGMDWSRLEKLTKEWMDKPGETEDKITLYIRQGRARRARRARKRIER